ncbi:WxcM-like domain-containing protein [Runella rosea]|uniref:WxcM-like domain-containing protein n=1 Tax=Runella rosea TaxID=2259595 RepID=A0A344TI53_9BACT|nr:FdtA/QdtA family cupin domain-containing protein [Runella rosea]AXE18324.1 WxcM-like domain-containing protein [Runella rosea]
MPQLIELSTFGDPNGKLTVFEKILPGDIKRAFYIYGVPPGEQRAKHGHKKTWNALIPVAGSCRIIVTSNDSEQIFYLNHPAQCLIIQPGDWHIMDEFSSDAILLVLSNEYYDKEDYVYQKP